jgi:regulatory protein
VNNPKKLINAKEFCFRLLKLRQRSEHELRQRLIRKKFTAETIEEVIAYLKKIKLINDREFSQSWIASRINNFGKRRIVFELRQKGISKELIEESLEEFKERFSDTDNLRELARKKYDKFLQENQDSFKAKKRLFAFFMRKGYSPEIIIEILESL